jgi:hypothetical protein
MKNGRAGLEDFREFARRLNISDERSDKLLAPSLARLESVEILIRRT